MTLDQQLATAMDVTAVFLDPAQRREELRADILATAATEPAASAVGKADGKAGGKPAGRTEGEIDHTAFQTRPTILRRLAALLADELPAPLDRLIAAEEGVALATAVALHTGLPFTVVRGSGTQDAELAGEIHRGERVAVLHPLTTTGGRAARTADLARERGAEVTGVFAVMDRGRGAASAVTGAGHQLHVLFPND